MFTGERVRLRAVTEADFPTFHEWWSDPEVLTHQTIDPITLRSQAENEEFFRGFKNTSTTVGFAIERLSDSVLIGECKLWGYTPTNRCATLAIILGRAFWNGGYGTEALRLLLEYAFNELNLHRVQLTVNADNARGIRAYEKAGFVREGQARETYFRAGEWRDIVYMGALRGDA